MPLPPRPLLKKKTKQKLFCFCDGFPKCNRGGGVCFFPFFLLNLTNILGDIQKFEVFIRTVLSIVIGDIYQYTK